MNEGPDGFAPKRYGIRSRLPIAWQAGRSCSLDRILAATSALANGKPAVVASVMAPATVLLLLIASPTTRGGWRWRKED